MTGRLADGADAIVATLTIAPDTRMGEVVHLPTVGGMTEITSLIGGNMIGRFTRCANAVVAGFATACSNRRVIEKDQQPAVGDMASVAGFIGSNMGLVSASCNITVMTAFTSAAHNRVIHTAYPSPAKSGMAELTGITSVDMVAVLALGGTTVMTGEAATAYRTMVKPGYMPTNGGVAVVTTVITANMVDRFASGTGLVMTAVAYHRRTLKLTFVMTLIALNVAMLTSERKSGCEMVELAILGLHEVH